ncbi:MAG: hypothetical protein LW832_00005, partial [Parachlamydia sp.]|nr:hypothetical protein [Parachlamydia sp.]
ISGNGINLSFGFLCLKAQVDCEIAGKNFIEGNSFNYCQDEISFQMAARCLNFRQINSKLRL